MLLPKVAGLRVSRGVKFHRRWRMSYPCESDPGSFNCCSGMQLTETEVVHACVKFCGQCMPARQAPRSALTSLTHSPRCRPERTTMTSGASDASCAKSSLRIRYSSIAPSVFPGRPQLPRPLEVMSGEGRACISDGGVYRGLIAIAGTERYGLPIAMRPRRV